MKHHEIVLQKCCSPQLSPLWPGLARLGLARFGLARFGLARFGLARVGPDWVDTERVKNLIKEFEKSKTHLTSVLKSYKNFYQLIFLRILMSLFSNFAHSLQHIGSKYIGFECEHNNGCEFEFKSFE